METVILFYLIIRAPNHPAVHFSAPIEGIIECLEEQKRFLMQPPHALLLSGGTIETGCQITIPPSREH